jgi:hypothetical protein
MAHAQRAAATKEEEHAMTTSPASGGLVVMDLGDDAGAGMEDLSMQEQLTPFLRILKKGSPQVDPALPEYNEDLRAGMIYDTATQEAYSGKDGIEVVVAARDYHYGMWVPRDSGGGFRGMVRPDDPAVRRLVAQHGRFKKLPHVTDDGEAVDLVETIQLYVLYAQSDLSDLNARRAIISMSSTALPVAQAYLTRHNSWRYRQPDNSSKPAQLWSYRWRFSLIPQQNAQGSWFNWRIDLLPPGAKPMEALVPRIDPLFAAGRAFYDMFRAGTIKADYEEAGKADGDQVPF